MLKLFFFPPKWNHHGVSQVFVLFILFFGVLQRIIAYPHRIKRVSDTHLADLETRVALNNKIKGIAITMPIGGGRVNPLKIGRKRRSKKHLMKILFNQSNEDDNKSEPFLMNFDKYI